MNIDWLTITPQSGKAGTNPISFQLVSENDSFEDKTIRIRAVCGNAKSEKTIVLKGKTYPIGTVFNFDYTGGVQQVTLPKGKYKLQCWGAKGGNSYQYSAEGSKGGYSEGILSLTKTTTLYVFVGGRGGPSGNGGWNCGGGSEGESRYSSGGTLGISYPACGGGATDICTVASNMSYSNKRNNRSSASLLSRCIVAGGGAGASSRYTEITETTKEWEYYKSHQTYTYKSSTGNIEAGVNTSLEAGNRYKIIVSPSDYTSAKIICRDANGTTVASGETVDVPSNATSFLAYIVYSSEYEIGVKVSITIQKEVDKEIVTTSSGKSNSSQQGGGMSGKGQYPGTQNSAGSGGDFGLGANQTTTGYRYVSGAGGGGWYGGGKGQSDTSTGYVNYSGGGSGFVNTAANAGYRPSGYTGLQLESGITKDGSTSFPSISGGNETGHSGNGYARITVLE